jgi:hypothetical protein
MIICWAKKGTLNEEGLLVVGTDVGHKTEEGTEK